MTAPTLPPNSCIPLQVETMTWWPDCLSSRTSCTFFSIGWTVEKSPGLSLVVGNMVLGMVLEVVWERPGIDNFDRGLCVSQSLIRLRAARPFLQSVAPHPEPAVSAVGPQETRVASCVASCVARQDGALSMRHERRCDEHVVEREAEAALR